MAPIPTNSKQYIIMSRSCFSGSGSENTCKIEQPHDKTNKMTMHPAKTQISLGIRPVWSVFAIRMKKHWILSYPLSALRRLIRLGRCPGWSESLLGAQSFCWFCHVVAQLLLLRLRLISMSSFENSNQCLSFQKWWQLVTSMLGHRKQTPILHTCHISHCEIKSHRIWPNWKAMHIRFFKSHRIFRPSHNPFYEEININNTLLCLSQASYI